MLESFKRVSNPLTIIAIFAGITEVGGTVILPFLSESNQTYYMWFLIIFPCLLILLFFLTLNFNNKVLYAPSDFSDENNFVELMGKQIKEMEHRLEKSVAKEVADNVAGLEAKFSKNELLAEARNYLKLEQYDEALESLNSVLEMGEDGVAYNLKAIVQARKIKYDQAIELCSKGLELDNSATVTASLYWNRACYKSLSNRSADVVIADLNEAILYNTELLEKLETDDDLENVRGTDQFNKLMKNTVGP